MKTEELTVDELVEELKKRPLHFVLAWWEDTNSKRQGYGGILSDLPDSDIVGTLESAIDFICHRSDEWGDD